MIDYDIQPIHLSQPANIKNGDQVYVVQHPRGKSLTFFSSESIVEGEYIYIFVWCNIVYVFIAVGQLLHCR